MNTKANQMSRTPGPWHVAEDKANGALVPLFITPAATDDTRETIAMVHMSNYHPDGLEAARAEARANAAFIVLACNSHDALTARVAALEGALRKIANETCDHGPGFCPRIVAQVALGRVGAGAVLAEEKPGETESTLRAENERLAAEHTQCHERNAQLVREHLGLKDSLRSIVRVCAQSDRNLTGPVYRDLISTIEREARTALGKGE